MKETKMAKTKKVKTAKYWKRLCESASYSSFRVFLKKSRFPKVKLDDVELDIQVWGDGYLSLTTTGFIKSKKILPLIARLRKLGPVDLDEIDSSVVKKLQKALRELRELRGLRNEKRAA